MISPITVASLVLLASVQPAAPIDPLPDCVSVARTVLSSTAARPLVWENGRPVVAIYRTLSGKEIALRFTWTDGLPCLVEATRAERESEQ